MAIILRLKAGSPNGLTETPAGAMHASNRRRRLLASRRGVPCTALLTKQTPPPHVRSAPFNSGMIAPGNHNFERFAAPCNTLSGEAGALRASGSPSWRPLQGAADTVGLQQPTGYTPSVSPFGLTAPPEVEPRVLRTRERREAKSLPYSWRCKTTGARHPARYTRSG